MVFAFTVVVVGLVLLFHNYLRKKLRRERLLDQIPGPPALPILGNTLEINVAHDGKLQNI